MKKKSRNQSRFVVCINNRGYEASLEAGKLYRVLPDDEAASHGYARVVDESGEDYGYAARRFFPIELPQALEKALVKVVGPLPKREVPGGARSKL
jgi:hypothetical protein